MAENKTKTTDASVDQYLAAIEDENRRADCLELVKLMTKITKQQPKMWGPGIVGFGSYRYKYESGHGGESCETGFASRKGDISVYLQAGFPGQEELLAALGRHKMGKPCLSIRRLDKVDPKVLEQLVSGSAVEIRRRHGKTAGG